MSRLLFVLVALIIYLSSVFADDVSASYGIKFIKVDGSSFVFGSDENYLKNFPSPFNTSLEERGFPVHITPHKVTVTTFFITETDITQKQYYKITGSNPSKIIGDEKPVYNLSWYDVVEFCNTLSTIDGRAPVYIIDKNKVDPNNQCRTDDKKWTIAINETANGYRLPTETEYEYASRGGVKSKGYLYSGSNNIDDAAWYCANSGSKKISELKYSYNDRINQTIHNVKSKGPNELGIFDLSGNVWKYCWDWLGTTNSDEETDPKGPVNSSFGKVIRGGSFMDYSFFGIVSMHNNFVAPNQKMNAGIRIVYNE